MNAGLTREEREQLIIEHMGTGATHLLDAHALDDVALLADILEDPTTWVEPPTDLADHVAATVSCVPRRGHLARRNRRRLVSSAGVATVMMALGIFVIARGTGARDSFRAALSSPIARTHASAAVHVTENDAGYRVTLDGDGLARLDEKRQYYQAWLTNAQGTAVPIGTFTSCDDPITMWSGASPKAFTTMTVTLESTDNVQTSSGRIVLAGELRST